MKAFAFVLFAALLLCASHAYQIDQSRDDLLAKYYAYVDAKVPKTARMIVGNEKVNAYIGQSVIGVETRNGELYSFEYAALANPDIVVIVSDEAAEKIENRSTGVLEAMDNGGIQIKTYSWLAMFKVAALRNAYALSGIDKRLTNRTIDERDIYNANSLFMVRQRVFVWN
ncbi:MAG: hypothetical protein NTX79_06215 [Candidatus Micrarchaeota archaeon]|nr:hypothetical protein [Candidatus Micrarchaeota archaeon]